MASRTAITLEDRTKRTLALNGGASSEVRRLIPLRRRRAAGAFFTGSDLAKRVISRVPLGQSSRPVFLDPACGAGDLLLAAAHRLPISSSLAATLEWWGSSLSGCDVHAEFVRATKARLGLLALKRTGNLAKTSLLKTENLFPLIKAANGLEIASAYEMADWIILNPPFSPSIVSKDCEWAKGSVTSAAVFVSKALLRARSGARIVAILPEVLRSGSRYKRWRQYVEEHGSIDSIRHIGRFDTCADVDVFILLLTKRPARIIQHQRNWYRKPSAGMKLETLYDIHVGAVVPHRHKKRGPITPYVHARSIAPWCKVSSIKETRRFSGTLFKPPFVAIRRTSRPEDKFRAIGVIVTGKKPVAVENHLIVCRPKDGTLAKCRQLLKRLRSAESNDFLNERIRCRHLTVVAVRELPI